MSETYERLTKAQLRAIAQIIDPDLRLPSQSRTAYLWGKNETSGKCIGDQGVVARLDRDGDLVVAVGPAGHDLASGMHLQPAAAPFPPTIEDLVHGQRFRADNITRVIIATDPASDTVVYRNLDNYALYTASYDNFNRRITAAANWALLA